MKVVVVIYEDAHTVVKTSGEFHSQCFYCET